jgi:uncharacterized membrane protein YdjX (TVP38/TMEM64 family)
VRSRAHTQAAGRSLRPCGLQCIRLVFGTPSANSRYAAMALTKRKAKRITKRYWPLAMAGLFLLALLGAWAVLPADQWVKTVGSEVAELGGLAPIVYVALYVVGTVILAPSPLMSVAAGVAFGWWGFPLAVIAGTAGATASFVLSRYFFNDDLEQWLKGRRIFRAAKQAVDEEGWRIQILLRISPAVPFGLLNYLLGLTKTPLLTYVLSTAVGILPGNFVDIYIGVIGQNLAGGTQIAYLVAGAVVTFACAILITLKARSCLQEAGVQA